MDDQRRRRHHHHHHHQDKEVNTTMLSNKQHEHESSAAADDDKQRNTMSHRSESAATTHMAVPSSSHKDSVPQQPKQAPQVISDVATFSDQAHTLEDALDLTDTPRLLLEATSPHRIIHMNAAFSKHIIGIGGSRGNATRGGTTTISSSSANSDDYCSQDWMEEQNSSRNLHARGNNQNSRSLQKAIEDIVPDNITIPPLMCYPVIVGDPNNITHYLIEATSLTQSRDDTTKKMMIRNHHSRELIPPPPPPLPSERRNIRQDTMEMYKPFGAIG